MIHVRQVAPDPAAPVRVRCTTCGRPLVKGNPRGRFTIGCPKCYAIMEVSDTAQQPRPVVVSRVR
jgi:phage FluMu protein Com